VFADLAVAAELVTRGVVGPWSRVAIFDFDVHHGDGTEALLTDNDRVLTFSVHRCGNGFYPGSGGSSLPEKHVYNRPLRSGDGNRELLEATSSFCDLSAAFGAEVIFIAGGADGHISDPLGGRHGGGIEYTVEGVAEAMRVLRASFPSTPILFGGAGGYLPVTSNDPLAEGPYGSTAEMWATATLTLAAGARVEAVR
jgi:acetoin utilization deacetylase AcuC-like enzyme